MVERRVYGYKKMNREKLKKGNGTMIIGVFLVLVLATSLSAVTHLFLLNEQSYRLQMAADSIADGTASYVMESGGSFSNAEKEANGIRKLFNEKTGSNISSVKINKSSFQNNQINVSVVEKVSNDPFHVKEIVRKAISQFSFSSFTGSSSGVMAWAEKIANDNTIGYIWGAAGPKAYDCSGFVANAYIAAGILPGKAETGIRLFSTSNECSYLLAHGFVEVTGSVNFSNGDGLQPGDVLWKSGHTELFYGKTKDGAKEIGAHGRDNYAFPDQISVKRYRGSAWKRAFRYKK